MMIFRDVKTLQDYESIGQTYTIPSTGIETTHITKGTVKVCDDDLGYEYKKGKLLYNGYGMKIIFEDNSALNTTFLKFRYISYRTYFDLDNLVSMNDTKYFFGNKEDKEEFMNFLSEYNKFMTNIFNQVVDKCLLYTDICFNNPMNGISSFLDELPEILFINDFSYCALLHFFTFRDVSINRFVNFTHYEEEQIVQHIRDNSNFHNAMDEIWVAIENFQGGMFQSNIKNYINEDYAICFTYFMLRRGLMEKYSSIWTLQYSNIPYTENFTEYVIQSVRTHVLTIDDERGIAALTYFLIKNENIKEDFRIVLRRVKEVLLSN